MSDTTRAAVFAELRKRNITTVTVSFSGGNDEGGADEIAVVLVDGTKTTLNNPGVSEDWDTKKMVVREWSTAAGSTTRPATSGDITQQSLMDALEGPVYSEYGSFAGEFSVNGTVTWDVTAGTVRMAKSESVESYEDSEYDL